MTTKEDTHRFMLRKTARRAGGSVPALLASFAVLVLAGCGSTPVHVVEPGESANRIEPAATAAKSAPRKTQAVQKRGGGYYKDDGPGDEIPDNLDDIPDAQPRLEPLHRFANRPYSVLGKNYVPDTTLRALRQRGVASWYGKKFHGQRTSIGEPYDMFSMTAAHPTLAIPSYVRVSNPANGKSVVVRVTDRGPFHADRIIDLSYAAAYRLGYINNGSTLVEVETILPGDATSVSYAQVKPPAPATGGRDEIELLASRLAAEPPTPASRPVTLAAGVYLQLGAFSNNDNAESLRAHIARELDWVDEPIVVVPSDSWYRVQVGPYPNRADAEKVAERIRLSYGQKPAFVVR
ncbi:septal ring lytic transglycosylase RlpA family protein [Propionivibrio dicarboxylicus]|uniref:Endolytic peptidoglycan transglycosylase RlpA n=1 Tax=Propionivibrio dicarboxylicus TaxID=83767 RepID=A0A1G7VYW1_9RHOO|nr:septal ring lytic transglycosylase RlpA family protein [Propionivibrio dicarboxylicus]SDG64903.1 rare lipoprotein A [Propionivibrio dicarboxylicus]